MNISVRLVNNDMRSLNVLSSADRYICWVALQNCIDYFSEVDAIGENPVIKKGSEIKVFRLFLNSIESLNNIIDYLYHDKCSKKIPEDLFKKKC